MQRDNPRRPRRRARVPQHAAAGAPCPAPGPIPTTKRGSSEAARRLFAMSRPIAGTLAEVYLRRRGVDPSIADTRALRFHPRCYYREADDAPADCRRRRRSGALTGTHRTWLDPASPGDKAPVSSPRRARFSASVCALARQATPGLHSSPPAKDSRPSCRCVWSCPICR